MVVGKEATLYQQLPHGRVRCTACARYCNMGEGQVGFCGIRGNVEGKLQLFVYGKIIAGHIDPIEKKPVSHYMPGTKIFSIATTGCSWACQYCFTPDTSIFTSRGVKTFEQLYKDGINEHVHGLNSEKDLHGVTALTHRGRFRPVRQVFRHFYSGRMLKIKPWGLPEIKCTPDHKILATSSPTGRPTKVQSRFITKKNYVVIPKLKHSEASTTNELMTFLKDFRENDPTTVVEDRGVSRHNGYALQILKLNGAQRENALDWQDARGLIVEQEDCYLVPVRTVTSEEYSGFVYNMEVEEDHTYVANTIAVSNCQNYDISQRRKVEGLDATPDSVVEMTKRYRCEGLAYTYNEPSIFIEFAHDIGVQARKAGLMNIFVSNGYDTPDSVGLMRDFLDCITVDFKGSGETGFVRKYITIANADPIFQTLLELRDKTNVHIEITDLIVPEVGDDLGAAKKLSSWIYDNLGPDTPIHFLRFHPDYKMLNLPSTPIGTLEKHHKIAKEVGLNYAYIGNVPGHPLEHTYCAECGAVVVERFGFDITGWKMDEGNCCKNCGNEIPIVGKLSKSVNDDRFIPVLM